MDDDLLSPKEVAKRLGVKATTLYDWLGQSDHGLLVIRGQRVTIRYLQGGPKGQGRIRLAAGEVERIKGFMEVRPQATRLRQPPVRANSFPGITVPLGRPPR
jgi:transposase-like protein